MSESPGDNSGARGISRAFIERTEFLKKKKKQAAPASNNPPAEELINITQDAQEELLSVNTIFPLHLFPDTVSVDRQKVSIIHRSFFRTANIYSVKISDVLNVESQVGPFVGSVKIFSKYFVDNFHEVTF